MIYVLKRSLIPFFMFTSVMMSAHSSFAQACINGRCGDGIRSSEIVVDEQNYDDIVELLQTITARDVNEKSESHIGNNGKLLKRHKCVKVMQTRVREGILWNSTETFEANNKSLVVDRENKQVRFYLYFGQDFLGMNCREIALATIQSYYDTQLDNKGHLRVLGRKEFHRDESFEDAIAK